MTDSKDKSGAAGKQPDQERVRDEVYGMRLEDIIEGARPPPARPKPQKKPKPETPWRGIEDQMANPTPGQGKGRRPNRRR